jgi:hypothetical protein
MVLAAGFLAAALAWSQEQPLPYSHKTHLSKGLQCKDCHVNPEPGEKMTFPATAKCMACHLTVARERPAIQKLAEMAKGGAEIPWARVYTVRAGTYWSHRSHLEASIVCAECHGDVASLDVMTRLTNVTSMEGCITCHRAKKAGTGCEFCHEAR